MSRVFAGKDKNVVHHAEFEPVAGNLKQGAGDGGAALGLDGLAVGKELVPGVVRACQLMISRVLLRKWGLIWA